MQLAGKVKFTGRFGDLISYKRNGKYFLRSIPEQVHQTEATRKASERFGDASRTGKLIRGLFAPFLYGKKDSGHVNRLNKRLIEQGVEGLQGYHFNQHTRTGDFVHATLGHDNILRVTNIFRPNRRKVTHLEIKLIAIRFDMATGQIINSVVREHRQEFYSWCTQFTPVELDANVPGKGTLVVALQINPYQDEYPLYDKRYHATDIIKIELPVNTTISKKQRRKERLQQQQKQLLQHQQQLAQLWQHYGDRKWIEPTQDFVYTTSNVSTQHNRLKEQRE